MATFPEIGPAYNLTRAPAFVVDTVKFGNRKEQRLLRTPDPRYSFFLCWPILTDAEKTQIQAFFVARKGRAEAFDLTDLDPTSPTYGQVSSVRFAQDVMNFEYFSYLLWSLNRVEMVGV